jgi:hypothetical protein
MTNWYQDYHRLVNQNSNNGVLSSSKEIANQYIDSNLFSETVLIDNVEHVAMVKQDKKSENKKLLLKPDTKVDIGAVVNYEDLNYLTMDFLGEGINKIYPTATLKLCNATFPIELNKSKVLLQDDNGNIIYDDLTEEPITVEVPSSIHLLSCIVENKYRVDTSNEQLWLPENEIMITLPYHSEIVLGFKFSMYDEQYEILNVDRTKVINDKGILVIRAKKEVR